MTERHGLALAEFAELCLSSARDLHARQLATEDAATAADLASALHKVGRSLRQSMALEARFRRGQETAQREVETQAVRAEEKRRGRRKAQVTAAVERLIWTEAGSEREAEGLISELEDLLDEEILADAFGDEPLEAHIARTCDRLGVIPSQTAPPADAQSAEDRWRSSA